MNLRGYEHAKFRLAELLRTLAVEAKTQGREVEGRLRELFVRLAEDRFNLVVVGRFSRGKTTLMNAILGTDRLPVGIVPLTSVITTVTYGSEERVIVHYEDDRLPGQVALDALPDYVTQRCNPGNFRRVKTAEVQLPAEILRRGFHFIDTPGLGSPIRDSTRTTEEFLPQADAFILVTSYESPLSEEEMRVMQQAASSARRAFVVLNKHDLVSREERGEVLRYARAQLAQSLGANAPPVFSVSAREGLMAKRSGDPAALTASGVAGFETELVRFLLAEKRVEFLLRMCDRLADLARALPGTPTLMELEKRIERFSRHVGADRPGVCVCGDTAAPAPPGVDVLQRFRPCEICERMLQASFDFLARYQYDLGIDPEVQRRHAGRGGFCPLHTWQYASLASPHGIATGYPALLERLSGWFRDAAASTGSPSALLSEMSDLLPTAQSCVVCRVCDDVEVEAVATVSGELSSAADPASAPLSAVCLPHLCLLLASVGNDGVVRKLLQREATVLDRLSEDMRRYATKHDAIRRTLATEEEANAAQRALSALVGLRNAHRSVHAPRRGGA